MLSDAGKPKSLVLVVGAGASYELKLPLGSELKERIAGLLDIRYDHRRISGDALIDAALRLITADASGRSDINPHLHAAWMIRDAMPQAISIDNFLDAHRGNARIAECAKLAIVRSILEAESKSPLQTDPRLGPIGLNFRSLQETWLNYFFQVLTENCRWEDLPERFARLAIVCFNYDRCIEHYLHFALQNYYQVKPGDATRVLAALDIFHPYGTVGDLPWRSVGPTSIAFGQHPPAQQLVTLSAGINTFAEGTNEKLADVAGMRSLVATADRIAFLGFAFHRMNLEMLFPKPAAQPPTRATKVFATGIGISKADGEAIAQELFGLAGLNPNFFVIARDIACAKLFSEFRRSLSLA